MRAGEWTDSLVYKLLSHLLYYCFHFYTKWGDVVTGVHCSAPHGLQPLVLTRWVVPEINQDWKEKKTTRTHTYTHYPQQFQMASKSTMGGGYKLFLQSIWWRYNGLIVSPQWFSAFLCCCHSNVNSYNSSNYTFISLGPRAITTISQKRQVVSAGPGLDGTLQYQSIYRGCGIH